MKTTVKITIEPAGKSHRISFRVKDGELTAEAVEALQGACKSYLRSHAERPSIEGDLAIMREKREYFEGGLQRCNDAIDEMDGMIYPEELSF